MERLLLFFQINLFHLVIFVNVQACDAILPWRIEGQIVADLNNNCQASPFEPRLTGWFVSVSGSTNQILITDEQGKFSLLVDDGTVTLTALVPYPSHIWQLCLPAITVNSNVNNPMAHVTFIAQSTDGGCPHTEVGITQPDLTRCSTSTYVVTVKNHGLGESSDLLLNLDLDSTLSLVSSSEPYMQSGNGLDFIIPPMYGLSQISIELNLKLACDVQLGATHGVVARLLPIECTPVWNGPRFEVEGRCESETVRFYLSNSGKGGLPMTRYRIMSDDLLNSDWADLILPEGAPAQTLTFPADGRTWRVELEQALGYPTPSHPIAVVEGCGNGENGLHSIAFRNAWRSDDEALHVATAFVPNTTGVPNKVAEATAGFGFYNFVGDTNWLEFTVRSRNPLSVEADSINFILSFSTNLDIGSFQIIASISPPTVIIDTLGTLRVTMRNQHIAPEASTMIRFRIRPLPGAIPDAGTSSLFRVDAQAFFNEQGPYPLATGFHNYSTLFPLELDTINTYASEVLRFGGSNFDFAISAATASDSTVFLTGETNSYSDRTNFDGMLIKTDKNGKAYWLTAIDFGDQTFNTFRGVVPLPDGGCIVAANYLIPGAQRYLSNTHACAARFDASGNMLWHKKYRPVSDSLGSWATGIIETADGQCLLYGYTESPSSGSDQFYLKINGDGLALWHQYEDIEGWSFYPQHAIRTTDGGFVFCGNSEGPVHTQKYDVFLEKINAEGMKIWSRGHNPEHNFSIGGIAQIPGSGFMVNGYSSQWQISLGKPVLTPTFVRFAPEGTWFLEAYHEIGPFSNASLYNIIPAPGGGYFSVGEVLMDTSDHKNDVLLLKSDDLGNVLWWKSYGSKNTEWAKSAVISGPDQLLLWGHNQARPPLYDLQAILVRTDWNGNYSVANKPEPRKDIVSVSVYPNPARTMCRVFCHSSIKLPVKWQIHDLTGRVVHSGISLNATFDLNIHHLTSGIYVLAFPDQQVPTQRVAVVH